MPRGTDGKGDAATPEHYEIPKERLPEGFVDTVLAVPRTQAVPKPAATVVVLRDGDGAPGRRAGSRGRAPSRAAAGGQGTPGAPAERGGTGAGPPLEPREPGPPEVLLLRRNRATGFVPGAWVFPGGRVDAADGEAALADRWVGLTPEGAAVRLGLATDAEPPAIAYYGAAVREAFEETGLLAAVVGAVAAAGTHGTRAAGARATGVTPTAAGAAAVLAGAREALLGRGIPFSQVLDRLGAHLDGTAIEYIAHWVTPAAEPRRYDTRFFAARVPRGATAVHDEREMTDAVWLTPRAALERHRAGRLPMIFPTIRTLEDLRDFRTAQDLLAHYRGRAVPRIQPEIVRTAAGVALRVP